MTRHPVDADNGPSTPAAPATDTPVHRLRRSALYLPASSGRALIKARELPADIIIIDLEDAVAPAAKDSARAAAIAAIRAGGFGTREVVLRVNGIETTWARDDIAAAATSGVDAVLFPKLGSQATLCAAIDLLDRSGGGHLSVWAMIETPDAVLDAVALAACAPRLSVMVLGTADLARALRLPADPARTGLLPALTLSVLAARARGVDILDGIFTDFRDAEGLLAACRQGKSLGFDGKTLIHPSQIEAANEVFGVSTDEADRATRIIAAWEQAAGAGRAIAVLDGRMIERLHADEARRTLALYRAQGRNSSGTNGP